MKKLYAVAYTAQHLTGMGQVQVQSVAWAVVAETEDEAVGRGVRQSKEQFKQEDSWGAHSAAAVVIPISVLREVLEQ